MKAVIKYQTDSGKEPFNEWLKSLDWVSQAKVDAYIIRVSLGSARKNIRPLGGGVYEIKIDHGPGYRVYFATLGSKTLLLLLGGDKSRQARDIRKATEYWRIFREKNSQL